MKYQMESSFEIFGEELSERLLTPEAEHLCNVKIYAKELNERKRDIFHCVVARLLFITNRMRPNIYPTVDYLCTHLMKSDEGDWKN